MMMGRVYKIKDHMFMIIVRIFKVFSNVSREDYINIKVPFKPSISNNEIR